jgi:hypothetical protein
MEVGVIDDADKGIKQRASGRCKCPLSKGGQGKIDLHVVGTGTVAYELEGQEFIYQHEVRVLPRTTYSLYHRLSLDSETNKYNLSSAKLLR